MEKVASISAEIKEKMKIQQNKRVTRAQQNKKEEEDFQHEKNKKGSPATPESDFNIHNINTQSRKNKLEIGAITSPKKRRKSSEVGDSSEEDQSEVVLTPISSTEKRSPKKGSPGGKSTPIRPKKTFSSKKPESKFEKDIKNRKYGLRSKKKPKAEPISDNQGEDPDWQQSTSDQSKNETHTPKKRRSTDEKIGKGSNKKPKNNHSSKDDLSVKNDPDDFTYPCEKCNDTFDNQEELQKHRRYCSKIPKKYMCPKCPKGFHQKSLKDQHYHHHHTKLPPLYVCHICNRIYEFDKTLKRHNKKYHDPNAKKFVCEVCGKEFRTNWEFSSSNNSIETVCTLT